ncbi:glutaredoxin family protein [Patescibacteria group bacterium]|nr:glutaredoxin family protein [Patescibacteria group bacterium]
MKKVTVFSTPTCHFCNMAKDYFTEHNIPFESFDVSNDPEKKKEMMDKSGQLGVPVILIDEEVVVGFNRPKLASLLGIQ